MYHNEKVIPNGTKVILQDGTKAKIKSSTGGATGITYAYYVDGALEYGKREKFKEILDNEAE